MVMRAKPEGSAKLSPLNMRTSQATRELLEEAAMRSGRSLQREVEDRLEKSLYDEKYIRHLWGQDVFSIAESMARSLWHIEREYRARWIDDDRVFKDFIGATSAIIGAYRDLVLRDRRPTPDGSIADLSDAERFKLFASMGGMSPPAPQETLDPEKDAADRADSLARWHERMSAARSRPLPNAAEIYAKRKADAEAPSPAKRTRKKP